MQQNPYATEIEPLSHITARSRGLFRNCKEARHFAAATAVILVLTSTAHAQDDAGRAAAQAASLPLPKIKTHAPAGFRLYRPGYRLAGKGALVTAQLCRLPGYASAGPQHLRVERLNASGRPGESHEQYLPRLGMRMGNNCSIASVRLDTVPNYGETIKICATSGAGNCP